NHEHCNGWILGEAEHQGHIQTHATDNHHARSRCDRRQPYSELGGSSVGKVYRLCCHTPSHSHPGGGFEEADQVGGEGGSSARSWCRSALFHNHDLRTSNSSLLEQPGTPEEGVQGSGGAGS